MLFRAHYCYALRYFTVKLGHGTRIRTWSEIPTAKSEEWELERLSVRLTTSWMRGD